MKKALYLVQLFLFITYFANATEWVSITSKQASPAEKNLVSSNTSSSKISFNIPGFDLIDVDTERGPAHILYLDDASYLLEAEAPDLLKLTASVVIPDRAGMDVRVVSSRYTDYENILIAPSKGNLYRDTDPETVPYSFGAVYERDEFYPGTLAALRDPFIMRDYRGQTVIAYPFQYNPVTRTLRVYHELEVEIFKSNDNGINPLIRENRLEKVSVEYAWLYEKQFLNSPQNVTDYTPVSEHGNMLIISYGAFMPAMQALVDWRIQTGTPVEMVDVATIGGSSQIKSYIASYYNTNGLTFVLLVGDAAQVPSSYASGDSDNNYAYIVGSDHYPDVFIGRFSAETIQQVETQVSRTITYEKNPDLNFDWFTRGIGIASDQGPGDDGEYDYQHIRNINTDLLDFTYTFCAELFDGSQGGNDQPGNPTPTMVATEVNTGATIITYTGHGSDNAWSSSNFSSTNVNSLTNTGMWPFIWSVACVNGNFVNGSCFAEAWLRATDNGEPTGAVATLMSTINQSWNPPMCGQDEMVDVLVETYPSNINRTFGAASMHGCMQMNDEYGGQGDEMTDTWVCFGDPSLHMRTAFPATMTASYMNTMFIGMNSLLIECDAEGAKACITKDGNILATGFVEGGEVNLVFDELDAPCTLLLTITGFNYLPHIANISVVPGTTPFLAFDDDHVVDPGGNGNGFFDFGESVTYTLDIINLGGVDATNIEVTLSTNDPYVTITDNFEQYNVIPAGQVIGIAEGFALDIAEDVPDEHVIDFMALATDGDTTWIIEYQNAAYAPVLNIGEMVIADNVSGNGNGRLDPGETATIKVKNFNSGHCPAVNCSASLTSNSQYLTFTNNTATVGTLGLLGSLWAEFEVTVDPDAPDGAAFAEFDYLLSSGILSASATFTKKIGLIYEDWETASFDKFEWQNGGNSPFTISDMYPYEGTYSARSGNIGDGEESTLEIDVEVMLSDSVTFFYKTSSQTNKDKLKFYINNTLQGEWSGVNSAWYRVAYPIAPGNYTFKWVYSKDASGMVGYDAAWVDFITFPPLMTLTCYAGTDANVCLGEDYQCYGEATDWVSLEWSTDGDGSFDDPTILDPIYTPGPDDISSGHAILTLTVEDIDGSMVDDEMTLNIIDIPEIPEMPQGPDYVNLYTTNTSEYTVQGVTYASHYEWKVEPANAGSIEGMGVVGTIDWNLDYLGTAYISVKGINSCGEGDYSEGFEVMVDNFTGVEDLTRNDRITIYPNPSTGDFTIQLDKAISSHVDISIFDLTGNLVYRAEELNADNGLHYTVGLGHHTPGLYFIRVNYSGGTIAGKVLVR